MYIKNIIKITNAVIQKVVQNFYICIFRMSVKDKKFYFVKLCSEKFQNNANSKNLPNAILKFQTTPKNAKIVKFGIENVEYRWLGGLKNHKSSYASNLNSKY